MTFKKRCLFCEIIDKNPGLTVDELHRKVKKTEKYIKAEKQEGTKIITEEEFLKMLE